MRNVGGRHCPLLRFQYAETGLHSAKSAAHATTVLAIISPTAMPESQRKIAVLFTRKTSRHTEILMKNSAQNSTIWLIKLYRPILAMDSSLRKQTWRPLPCLTPTMLKALRIIVSTAAMRIVQSSDPRELLRAQSLNAVVIALGTMKIAAGMRSTLPILSSAGRGSQAENGIV